MIVLIPLAGKDERYLASGFPKPLVPIKNKPLIQYCLERQAWLLEHKIHFITHIDDETYFLKKRLLEMYPDSTVHVISERTQGAACTVLLFESFINNDEELIIYLADIDFTGDLKSFIDSKKIAQINSLSEKISEVAGIIPVFKNNNSKYSYALTNNKNVISRVAEKEVISDNASAGLYYFRKGKYFVSSAKKMIEKDLRVNNAFFICPVYNELLAQKQQCMTFLVDFVKDFGTDESVHELIDQNINEINK